MPDRIADINRIIRDVFPMVRDLRRDLHKHPEIQYEEVRTAGKVSAHLKRLKIPHRTKVGDTGVVALIKGKRRGKCVALRADMDALPMPEATGLPYRSVNEGKMHACGHDGHTANLVGVAHVLSRLKDELKGSVKLIFQPAEEAGERGGAELMIRNGALRDPKPDVIFGLHTSHLYPVGSVAVRPGTMMASADFFDIVIRGRGAHAAYPHKGIDPIVIASAVLTELQTIVSRQLDPLQPAVVTIGQVQGGSASNVIPEEVRLGGTCRAYDRRARRMLLSQIRKISVNVARALGGSAEARLIKGYPPTINHDGPVAFLRETAAGALDAQNLVEAPPSMGGEDFSFYMEKVPGAFFWLGNGRPEVSIHNPMFDFNDQALKTGMLVMSLLALRWPPE